MRSNLINTPYKNTIAVLILGLAMSSCSSKIFGPPKKNPRIGEEQISVVTGKTSGISFTEFNKKNNPSDSAPVNAILWRAALDIASFVPLDDVDTFGGSIVTEWHQSPEEPKKRLKLAIFVSGVELRSDAVRVQTYTQKKLGNDWVNGGRDEALARRLEDLILTRARELRAASISETTQ